MRFTWDHAKSGKTLVERGFDFAYAARLFEAPRIEFQDTRKDYGEIRMVTMGRVDGRALVVLFVMRGDDECHIISARRANAREIKRHVL